PLSLVFSPVPATTLLYTLSLHDALPISKHRLRVFQHENRQAPLHAGGPLSCQSVAADETFVPIDGEAEPCFERRVVRRQFGAPGDRKSTRLNSSHVSISYAVFCLKKKIK